ncbi:MAG: hypothetical protein ACI865_002508 [Flavobacteriaceae bacterium]
MELQIKADIGMNFRFFVFIGLIISVTLASCGSVKPISEEVVIDELPPEIIRSMKSVLLFSSDKSDSLKSSITYQYYHSTGTPYKDSVNCLIKQFVADQTEYEGNASVNCDVSHKFMSDELSVFEAAFKREILDGYDFGVWSLEIDIKINEDYENFIELLASTWAFTGGAHGNGYYGIDLVDKKSGGTLNLTDFFSDVSALNAIVAPIFRESQDLTFDEDLENAGFWFDGGVFSVNENFSFNSGSLTFIYNAYEIAPYSRGSIEVTLPIEDVKHLLIRSVD